MRRGQLARVHIRRQLWQASGGRSKPAFIFGCGRSGTSLLLYGLSRTWQVEAFNEDHKLAFEDYRLRDWAKIKALIEGSRAPLVLFKPILSTPLADGALSQFPNARAIFVYRHYSDVVNSSLARFGRDNRINHVRAWMANDFGEFAFSPPPEPTKNIIRKFWRPELNPESGAALYWLFYNRLFFDLKLSADSRTQLVKYEAAVRRPNVWFRSLAEFLGIQYEPAMSDGVYESSINRDPAPPIQAEIEDQCEQLWQELNAVSKASAVAPSRSKEGNL